MTFERFMGLALYHPELGYYTRPGMSLGPEADFTTSPEIHPAFGALLCVQIEEMWRNLGEPSPFWLAELGPGRGTFVHNVLRTCHDAFPRLFASLRVVLIERSPSLKAAQSEMLERWADRVSWEDPDPIAWAAHGPGCVFANEWLDSLPVHRVVLRPAGLREILVGLVGEHFVEVEGSPSSPELERQIEAGGGRLRPGQYAEVNLDAPALASAATRLIDRGYMLLLDYGAPAHELYSWRHPRGTLRCYRGHTMNEDPFTAVGLQDMTSHVDFSAVTRAVESAGANLVGATEQRRLLGRLGMPALQAMIDDFAAGRAAQRAHRAALHALVDSHGLGGVLAVAYGVSASGAPLSGFTRTTPLSPPRLPFLWEPRRTNWTSPQSDSDRGD